MNTTKQSTKRLNRSSERSTNTGGDSNSLRVTDLGLELAGMPILKNISFSLPAQGISTVIGPSGAGKSTLLRCMNLLHEGWRGELTIMGRPARQWPGGADALRRQVGLIAQKPAVFPCSIRENVLFGLRHRERKHCTATHFEGLLHQAALWNEVRDRLDQPAITLSIGQQQRLCIARTLALKPEILLLDEPTASLDPRSRQLIEVLMCDLAASLPVLCVTHDLEQARRLGGQVIFMCDGRIIETAQAADFFSRPQRLESREFLRWANCDCS